MATQQAWLFNVGDSGDPENFDPLEGLFDFPEFNPLDRTLRDDTDINHANTSAMKKWAFNRMIDGQELPLKCDYLPTATAQARLIAAIGDNAGVNVQYVWTDGTRTETWQFSVLVRSAPYEPSSSSDENAKDMVTFNLKINATLPTQAVT
jgi:hypothetical protein